MNNKFVVTLTILLFVVMSVVVASANGSKSHYIKPGAHVRFEIQIESNSRFLAELSATGGAGNDVEVFLMSKRDYIKWLNNRQADINFYYKSGRVKSESIEVLLKPDEYVLVISNEFSLVSYKQVDLTMNIAPI